MLQLPVLQILLELTAFQEAQSRELVDPVGSSDLDLIPGLRLLSLLVTLFVLAQVFRLHQLVSEQVAQVPDQRIEIVEL